MNALDPQLSILDNENETRGTFFQLLQTIMTPHIEITSASANVDSSKVTRQCQTTDLQILFLLGGMSDVGCLLSTFCSVDMHIKLD